MNRSSDGGAATAQDSTAEATGALVNGTGSFSGADLNRSLRGESLKESQVLTGETKRPGISVLSERIKSRLNTPAHQQRLAEEAQRQQEREREALRRRATLMGIPIEADLRSIVDDNDAPVSAPMRTVRNILNLQAARGCGLLLVLGGPTGVGKTAAACHALARHNAGGRFVRAHTIGSTPRTGFSEVNAVWDQWESTPFLLIDDAGTEQTHFNLIAELLRNRFDEGRITVVSTNLDRGAFEARYLFDEYGRLADRFINAQGRSIGDAIGEGGIDWYAGFDGASLRSVEAQERFLKGVKR